MKSRFLLFVYLVAGICLVGCQEWPIVPNENALIIKSASTDRVYEYPIGSAFVGGQIVDFKEGSTYRCYLYREKLTEEPEDYESLIVSVSGFWHQGVEYTVPGQQVDLITISGIDETLGLGKNLIIPMNQGVYNGGNDIIRDVQIISLKSSTPKDNSGTLNKDADINIVIHSTAGDTITVRFANDITWHRGAGAR